MARYYFSDEYRGLPAPNGTDVGSSRMLQHYLGGGNRNYSYAIPASVNQCYLTFNSWRSTLPSNTLSWNGNTATISLVVATGSTSVFGMWNIYRNGALVASTAEVALSAGTKTWAVTFNGSGVGTDNFSMEFYTRNSASMTVTIAVSLDNTNSYIDHNITEFVGVAPAEVTPVAQYKDDGTYVATGDPTGTAGNTTGLMLETDVYSIATAYPHVSQVEEDPVGTAFSDTASISTKSYIPKPATLPTARRGAVMTYDPINKRYLTTGGYDGTTRFNQLWELDHDPTYASWLQLSPTGTAPAGKNLGAAIQIVNNGKSWMFYWGGSTGSDNNALQILDATTRGSEAWTTVTQTSAPAVRSFNTHMIAAVNTSSTTTDIYLFGGWGASRLNDLYRVTVSTAGAVPTALTWTALKANGAVGNPSARSGSFMFYDSVNARLIMTMGYTGSAALNDVWAYSISGNSWSQLSPTGTAPAGRELMSGGYDPVSQQLVMFGGWTGSATTSNFNDIIQLDFSSSTSGAWSTLKPHDWPNSDIFPFSSGAAAYNTDLRCIVEFGQNGYDATDKYLYAYNFLKDRNQLFGLNVVDDYRERDAPAFAWNSNRGEFLIIGGYSNMHNAEVNAAATNGDHMNEIWAWNPTTDTVRYANKGIFGMTFKEGSMGVYDSVGDRVLVFGGLVGSNEYCNDTWELKADASGNYEARLMAPSGTKPPVRWLGAAAYDSARNRMIIWGGCNTVMLGDCWQLDLSTSDGTWTQLTPTGTAPTSTLQPAYSYDNTTKRMYVAAGATTVGLGSPTAQLWYLDYTNATPSYNIIGSPTGLTAVRGGALGYDATNDRLYFFGGYTGSVISDQTLYRAASAASGTAWTATGGVVGAGSPIGRRSSAYLYNGTHFYMAAGRPQTGRWFKDFWRLTGATTPSTWTRLEPKLISRFTHKITGKSDGSYHWQSNVVVNGTAATWTAYGGNSESAADYIIGDSIIKPQFTTTHSTDAIKRRAVTLLHTTSVIRRKAFSLVHTTSSNLKRSGISRTHTTDSLKRKATTVAHTADANKRKASTVSHTTGAFLFRAAQTLTKTHSTDSLKRKASTLSHTTSANKRTAGLLNTHSTGALLRKASTLAHTTDAHKRLNAQTVTTTHSTDSLKKKSGLTLSHTTDSLKRKQSTASHTTDSLKRSQSTRSHTTSANKRKANTLSHSTSALKRLATVKFHLTDANKRVSGLIRSHTTDANKRVAGALKTHTTDSLKRKQNTLSHTTDSLKRKDNSLTHTTSSVIRKLNTRTHTTDAFKRIRVALSHTTDALKRKQLALSHTTDALKRKTVTTSHTTNALKRTANVLGHAVDSFKKVQGYLSHTTSSRIYKTSLADITDNFDDNIVDTTKWSIAASHYEVNGRAEFFRNQTGGLELRTLNFLPITDSQVFFEYGSTGISFNASVILDLRNASNTHLLRLEHLYNDQVNIFLNGSFTSVGSFTFHPTNTAWLRFRETAGTIYVEYAPHPNSGWTVAFSATSPAGLDSVQFVGTGGFFGSKDDQGGGWIDNFNILASPAATYTSTHSTDSLKRKAATVFHLTDANKRKANNLLSHTTDTLKRVVSVKSHTTDALKRLTSVRTHTTGALLRRSASLAHSTSANLKKAALALVHSTDTNKKKANNTLVHSTSSNRKKSGNLVVHLTDALKRVAFTKSHTTDSLLRRQISKTHTTDALKRKANTLSHSTSANKKKSSTVFHTTSANKKRSGFTVFHTTSSNKKRANNSLSHTTNALKRAQSSISHFTDVLRRLQSSKSHSTDSLLRRQLTLSHSTSSNKKKANNLVSHTTDSLKRTLNTLSHSTNALKKQRQSLVHSTSSFLRRAISLVHSTSAFLRTRNARSHTTDSNKRKANNLLVHSTSSNKRKATVLTHTTDALKRTTRTLSHTTSAFKRVRISLVHSTSSLLRQRKTLSHSTNSFLRTAGGLFHVTDTNKRKATILSHSTSSNKRVDGRLLSHTTNALLRAARTLSHSTSASKKKAGNVVAHTTNALKRKGLSLVHSTSAYLRRGSGVAHSTDSTKKKRNTLTHTVDTLIRKSRSLVHSTDSFRYKRSLLTHATDTIKHLARQLSHSTSANKRDSGVVSHSTSSVLRILNAKNHTTDSFLKERYIIVHSTDSYLRDVQNISHSTSANKKRGQAISHSTSAILADSVGIGHTTDAQLYTLEGRKKVLVNGEWVYAGVYYLVGGEWYEGKVFYKDADGNWLESK